MIRSNLNPNWVLPLTKKQHSILFLVYSIVYFSFDLDTFLENYSLMIESVVYIFLFLSLEFILHFSYFLFSKFKSNKKGNI